MNLPPLPKPDVAACTIYQYTADQMREYGEACCKRALEEAAQKCDQVATDAKAEPRWKLLTQAGKQLHEGIWGGATNCAKAIRSMK